MEVSPGGAEEEGVAPLNRIPVEKTVSFPGKRKSHWKP